MSGSNEVDHAHFIPNGDDVNSSRRQDMIHVVAIILIETVYSFLKIEGVISIFLSTQVQ